MKATDKAYEKLETILNAHGFELTEGFAGKDDGLAARPRGRRTCRSRPALVGREVDRFL